jgi:CelD/BcsL family acetyltransferase involved in cellulose biosynthesis
MTRIEVITNLEELHALAADWKSLGARFPTPLLQYEWFLSCAETLYSGGELRVVTLEEDGRLTALAPLAQVRRRHGRWLEIMGVSKLHEPAGLLYENPAALERLMQALTRLGHPLDLGRLPGSSPLLTGPGIHIHARGLWLRRPGADRCVLDLQEGWDAVWSAMRKSRRTDFRRLERRARDQGGFELQVEKPAPAQVDDLLEQAMDIEAAGWKASRGNTLRQDPILADFFHRYCRRMAEHGALYLYFLRIGEHTVAMHVTVSFAGALWVLKIGYDERWRTLSPGLYLALETIRHAARNGLTAYEFLGSAEDWQGAWPSRRESHGTRICLPLSAEGLRGLLDLASARLGRHTSRPDRAAPA